MAYKVEKIVDHMTVREWLATDLCKFGPKADRKEIRYQVRWMGYRSDSDTFEPAENIKHTSAFRKYLAKKPDLARHLYDTGVISRLPPPLPSYFTSGASPQTSPVNKHLSDKVVTPDERKESKKENQQSTSQGSTSALTTAAKEMTITVANDSGHYESGDISLIDITTPTVPARVPPLVIRPTAKSMAPVMLPSLTDVGENPPDHIGSTVSTTSEMACQTDPVIVINFE